MLNFHRSITSGDSAYKQMDGKEYLVVPSTIIVAGVLNNGLVSAFELQAFAERWNGRPIPLRHPQDAQGNHISASSPDVVESHVVGTFYNAHFEVDRIAGEMWLDVAKMERLGGLALETLETLKAGGTIEVSTGYWAENVERRSGSQNGRKYAEVHKGLVPDHIALLPNEIGACSISDGCGAGFTNADNKDYSNSVMIAFYLSPSKATELGALWADSKTAVPISELHVTLTYLGDMETLQTNYNELAQLLADFSRETVAMVGEVGGWTRFTGETEDAITLLVDSEPLVSFRQWMANVLEWNYEQPVARPIQYIPHITLAYVPTGDGVTLNSVERISLIFSQIALSWGDQTVVFPLIGQERDTMTALKAATENTMSKVNEVTKTPCEGGAAVQNNAVEGGNSGDTKIPKAEVQTPAVPQLPEGIVKLMAMVDRFGGVEKLEGAINATVEAQRTERTDLIARIKTNASNTLSDQELEGAATPILRALANSGTPVANYQGRSGMQVNTYLANEADSDSAYEPFTTE